MVVAPSSHFILPNLDCLMNKYTLGVIVFLPLSFPMRDYVTCPNFCNLLNRLKLSKYFSTIKDYLGMFDPLLFKKQLKLSKCITMNMWEMNTLVLHCFLVERISDRSRLMLMDDKWQGGVGVFNIMTWESEFLFIKILLELGWIRLFSDINF